MTSRFHDRRFAALAMAAVLALVSALAADDAKGKAAATVVAVETIDGKRASGSLTELSVERIILRGDSGQAGDLSFATNQVSHVAVVSPESVKIADGAAWIELVDGAQLIAYDVSLADRTLSYKSTEAERLTVATRDVRSIRLQTATDAALGRWSEIASRAAAGDQLVVRKGEQTIDSLEGTIRGITADSVKFELDGDESAVKRDRVFGMVFYQPAGRQLARPACTVVDATGMKLPAATLAASGGDLSITTPAGVKLNRPLSRIARIDFAASKTVYLSDLKPESVEWTPLVGPASSELSQLYQPRGDRALFGGPLLLPRREGMRYVSAVPYAKGLAIHSRTKIVYRLPREFRSLSAIAGIDSRVRPAGNVQLSLLADDKRLYTGVISGKVDAVALSLDVRGAKRLTIVVDFGDELDVADHLNLVDARLVE